MSHSNPRNIGEPSDTTTSYILIPGTVENAPLLVPGELCLGGAQLARGYLNLVEETKKRFIDTAFGHDLGSCRNNTYNKFLVNS